MEDPSFEDLTTRRLVIRRFASNDAEALASYRNDAEVARYQSWECPYSLGEARQLIANLQPAPGTPCTWFQFAVSLASSRALIGDVALRTRKADPQQAELGFTFARAHQGQGYAAEAVGAVLQYAFGKLELHRVFSQTDVRNHRAQRLLERLRFRREGELRESTWFKGAWVTDLIYAQLESEWRQPPRGMPMDTIRLREFATKYTAAWCSQNPASVAEFFAEGGSLQINDGTPSVGRAAITAAAQGFMTAFPDMVVAMDAISLDGDQAVYRWTLTGSNTGPDGTGNAVRISGYEEWTIGANGLIAKSMGHFDEADYQRQLKTIVL